jgi:hypothetical protein
MAKLTLNNFTTLSTGSAVTTLNNNNDAIEAALENTLSRDGTSPNSMQANLDMNSYRIENLVAAVGNTEPVRLAEMTTELDALEATVQAIASTTQGYLNNVISLYDQFDDRYLGNKASDPTLDNDGAALQTGALYFNTTSLVMKVYNGSAWNPVIGSVSSSTLDDLSDVTITAAASGDILRYDGSAWVDYPDSNYAASVHTHVSTDITDFTEATQDAVGAMIDTTLNYVDGTPLLQRAALTGHVTASAGSNALVLGSFTQAQLNTAVSDADLLSVATAASTYQPLDSDLTTIAGLTATSDNFIQAKSSAWASRTVAQVKTDLGLTGTNSGDQTSIVGITGTKAEFDTAVTDGNILYVGDVTQYTDEMAQDAIGTMIDSSLTYVDGTPLLQRAALTGHITAGAGSNATVLGSFTYAQLNTAVSDADVEKMGTRQTINTQTADYVAALVDAGALVKMNAAGANTFTVPANATVAFPTGSWIDVAQYGAGVTTITAAVGVTIRSRDGKIATAGQYAGCTVIKIDTNEWMLFGDLA